MSDKISIIIPVYNVADYLREALDSVLNQTYTHWEAICINDGSTDNSLDILKEYAHKDSRFIVIDQENGGVSKARNVGLDNASGEYVMFLDPDDYFYPYTCKKAYQKIIKEDSDIVIFGFENLYNIEIKQSLKNKDIKEIIAGSQTFDCSKFIMVCMKIFKKSFLIEKNIKFLTSQDVAEDMMFSFETYYNHPKIAFIDESLYVYRRNRKNSLTTANINGIKSEIIAAKTMIKSELYLKSSDEMKECFIKECARNSFYYFAKFSDLPSKIKLYFDIHNMIFFWEKNYDINKLLKLDEYINLKIMHKKFFLNYTLNLFPQKKYSDDFKEYLKEIQFKKYLKILNKKLKNKKIIIYGTGSFYQYIAENYDLSNINIIGVSDLKFSIDQEGQLLNGYKIIPKAKIRDYNPDHILIAAKNYDNILENFKSYIFKKSKIKITPLAKKPLF